MSSKKQGYTRVLGKGKQFLPRMWHSSCYLVTNPVISHEWGKDRIVITTNGTYPWSFVTQIFRNG
jgi:hypothetical protein